MKEIGTAQFRAMCEMWGVDDAIKALKSIGMEATKEQIEEERKREILYHERWNNLLLNNLFREKHGD